MLKQTIKLLIKASIIGILINVGLEQLPARPMLLDKSTTVQSGTEIPEQPVTNTRSHSEP